MFTMSLTITLQGQANPGEILAIMGQSGAGMSSVALQ
jgi:ABC-type glutathione transport system ATPase component